MTDWKEPLDVEAQECCREIAGKIDAAAEKLGKAIEEAVKELRGPGKAAAAGNALPAKLDEALAAPSEARSRAAEIGRKIGETGVPAKDPAYVGAAVRQWTAAAQLGERGGETEAFREPAHDPRLAESLPEDEPAVSAQSAAPGRVQAAGMSGNETTALLQALREARQGFSESGGAVREAAAAAGRLRPLDDALDSMREVFDEEIEAREKALVREAYGRAETVRAFEALGRPAANLREAAADLERAARQDLRRRRAEPFQKEMLSGLDRLNNRRHAFPEGLAKKQLLWKQPLEREGIGAIGSIDAAEQWTQAKPEDADGTDSALLGLILDFPLSVVSDLLSSFILKRLSGWRRPRSRATAKGSGSAGPDGVQATGGIRGAARRIDSAARDMGGKVKGFAAGAGGRIAAAGRGLPVKLAGSWLGAGAAALGKTREIAVRGTRAASAAAGVAQAADGAGRLGHLLAAGGRGAALLAKGAGSFGGTGRLVKAAARRIPLLGPLLGAGQLAAALTDDELQGKAKAEAAGGAAGDMAGALAGAAAGAALGSVVPGVGTAIGGLLGGLAGGFGGQLLGAKIAAGIVPSRAQAAAGDGLALAGPLPAAAGLLAAAPAQAALPSANRGSQAADGSAISDSPTRGSAPMTIAQAAQHGGVYIRELIINQQPGEDPSKLADRVIEEIEERMNEARRDALYDID